MGVSAFKLVSAGSDGKSIRDTKVQVSHGLQPGDVIRYDVPLDGSAEGFTAAIATSAIEAEAVGIVESVNGIIARIDEQNMSLTGRYVQFDGTPIEW